MSAAPLSLFRRLALELLQLAISEARGRLYLARKEKSGCHKVAQNGPACGSTAAEVAKETGVSRNTVKRDAQRLIAVDKIALTHRAAVCDNAGAYDLSQTKTNVAFLRVGTFQVIRNRRAGSPFWEQQMATNEEWNAATERMATELNDADSGVPNTVTLELAVHGTGELNGHVFCTIPITLIAENDEAAIDRAIKGVKDLAATFAREYANELTPEPATTGGKGD